MNKKTLLHHLRNPYGIDEVEMRKARLQAADELERLYNIEQQFKVCILKISDINALLEKD
jgi:hypothetical protein